MELNQLAKALGYIEETLAILIDKSDLSIFNESMLVHKLAAEIQLRLFNYEGAMRHALNAASVSSSYMEYVKNTDTSDDGLGELNTFDVVIDAHGVSTDVFDIVALCYGKIKDDRAISCGEEAIKRRQLMLSRNRPEDFAEYVTDDTKVVYLQAVKGRKLLGAPHRNSDYPELATSYSNLSTIYNDIGQYDKAIEYAKKAHEIRNRVLPDFHPMLILSYCDVGTCYCKLNQHSNALIYFEKAFTLRENATHIIETAFAPHYYNALTCYVATDRYDKALKHGKRILRDEKIQQSYSLLEKAQIYQYVGTAYKKIGDDKNAQHFISKAASMVELKCHHVVEMSDANKFFLAYEITRDEKKYFFAYKLISGSDTEITGETKIFSVVHKGGEVYLEEVNDNVISELFKLKIKIQRKLNESK